MSSQQSSVSRSGSEPRRGSSSSSQCFPRQAEMSSDHGSSTSNAPAPPGNIATENEGLNYLKDDNTQLETWDPSHRQWRKFWATFGTWNNRQIVKDINASPQVLRTYHDSFLYGDVPFSVRTRTTLRAGTIGKAWKLMEFVLALLSGVLYVYSTYKSYSYDHNWTSRVQNAISVAFAADYIFQVYCEPVRFYFIFSIWGIIDLLSILPVILIFRSHIKEGSILRLFQFLRAGRIFSLTNKVGFFGSSVTHQIILLTIATFGVIFLDAGILQWVESYTGPASKRAKCPEQGCITFWEALYFLIVTVSTVGYGDITPSTMLGQLVAIITIIAAFSVLPIQIGRITSLAYRRPYGGSFRSRKIISSRFLIISGSVTFAAIQNLLAEFYNPTHCEGGSRLDYIIIFAPLEIIFYLPDLEDYPLHVIILAPFSPSFEIKQVLALYNGLVEFIEGSPVRQSDLERVSADRATAFFLLADNEAENAEVEDAAQVVRALAVHRFCYANRYKGNVRIILEVLDPETHGSAVWDDSHTGGIEVICPVKVHYKMMARSCAVHGLYTLITNLFTSELQLKHINSKHFLAEYFHSFDNEVYPVIFPECFHLCSFEEVAEFVFVNFGSTLFAVDTSLGYTLNGHADRKVLLFPKGHRIHSDDIGLVIASSLRTAQAISKHTPKEEGVRSLHKFWERAAMSATSKTEIQGIELLDPSSGKWSRRNSMTNSPVPIIRTSTAFGEDDSYGHPRTSDLRLEKHLRSAIQSEYTTQQYPDWGKNHPVTAQEGIWHWCDTEAPESESKPNIDRLGSKAEQTSRRGMSLQRAADDLLAWPPATYGDRPHPAIVREREDNILKHLKENTINMVALGTPHILVCCQSGWPAHFFYFLLEVRKPGYPNPPVVILHPKDLTAQQWGSVGSFKDVFFLKGSPAYELDLLRGGVLQAEKVVILSNQGRPVDLGGEATKNYLKRTPTVYTSDVENIIVAANVQRLYGQRPNENVIVEMQHPEGFYYLRPQYEISHGHFPTTGFRRNRDALVHFATPFIEGKAVSSDMLGFLMRSSFYNRNTLSIVEQLIHGGHIKTEEGLRMDNQRVLDQVAIPEKFANRPYSHLFLGLLRENGALAIGLYRARDTLGSPTAYVLSNPAQDCIVNRGDLVYILH